MYTEQVAILKRLLSRRGMQKDMAERLGVTRQWLERAVAGHVPLGAETCVQIALEYGGRALPLLRAAGKSKLADLLERGGFEGDEIPARDRDHLRALNALPDEPQTAIRALVESLRLPTKPRQRRSRA